MFGLDAAWVWLALAALLAIAELIAPGIFLVWVAGAALLTGLATFLFPVALPFQLLLFALFSVGTVLAGRRIYERPDHTPIDPLLNDRAAQLIGRTVTVARAIAEGEGRVRVGDTEWPARGADAPVGARVRITGTKANCLLVGPLEAEHIVPAERQ